MADGLIIKKEWLRQIFNACYPFTEQKTWETRRHSTTKRGKIYLIESGSSKIVGEAKIVDSIEIKDADTWYNNFNKHQICNPTGENIECCPYELIQAYFKGHIHAWVLTDIKKYINPVKYKHPKGAIIWVKLDDDIINQITE